MKLNTSRISFEEAVLIGLLALVPIVFSRVTAEVFEIPQSSLLATGALLLLWRALGGEIGAFARLGVGRALNTALVRLTSWAMRDPLGVGILLFLVSAVVSTIASPNPALSIHGAPDSTAGLVAAFSTAAVYFTSRVVSRGQPATLVRYARAAGFASAITSAYALIQLAGLDPLIWGRMAMYEGDVRIFGTLGHPNMLGAYLAMTAPLTVWLAMRARSAIERAVWALVASVSVVVIAATLSRGAWIGLAGAAFAWMVLGLLASRGRAAAGGTRRPRRSVGIPAAVAAALLVGVAAVLVFARTPMGPHLAERARQLTSLNAPTTQSRIHLWRAGLRMAHDHPLLGVGVDAFGIEFPRYRTAEYWRIELGGTPNRAHNEAIQILATQGIVGGIAALLVLGFAGVAILRRAVGGEGLARTGAVAAGASLVAFAGQDLVSFTVVALGSLAAAMAGWLTSTSTSERYQGKGSARRDVPLWARALAGIPVAILFAWLIVIPIRAQIYEKAGLKASAGSPERVQAYELASRYAPWNSRYTNLLGASLLAQAEREPSVVRVRDVLRRAAAAERSAIATEPQNGYHYATLGRVAAAQAQLQPPDATAADVRSAFSEAMARDPVNAQIMDQASNSLVRVGDAAEARAIALRSARLYPDLGQPMAYLGYAATIEGRYQDAADTLRLAVDRNWWAEVSARAATWSNLSAAYLALGRNEDALRAAEEALDVNPSNRDAEANRRIALERLGGDGSKASGGSAR